jgi:hypothetical protein
LTDVTILVVKKKEKGDVMLSTTCWCIMLASLLAMACAFSPLQVLKMYGIPVRKPTNHSTSTVLAYCQFYY